MEKDEKTVGAEQGSEVLIIEPIEESQREKEVREVSETARKQALEKLKQATELTDYLCWHRAATLYFTPPYLDWMWDYDGTTVEELMIEQEANTGYGKNAASAETMRAMLEALEPKPGFIRVALKRIRDHEDRYSYRVLAAFPEEIQVTDPIDGMAKDIGQREGTDIIFFEPENACVSHACDDLYKAKRGFAFYIKFRKLDEALKILQTNKEGVNEYLIEKTQNGNITQDAQNFLLVGLLGGYSNERLRVRISDFWNRSPSA